MCNAAAHSPLKFPQSHFNPVYKLKAMRETKMENIAAAVKRLAVQKAYFYLCHATQVTTNIFCWPGALPSGKQRITPTLSHLSITHGNLNCHNKVFFQDLSSNSLSFLLKWLSRVSRKSRGRIVIRNRWSPNHRWCRGEGWEGKGGRTAGGKTASPSGEAAASAFLSVKSIDICHRTLRDCRLYFPDAYGERYIPDFQQRGTGCPASPAGWRARSWVLIDYVSSDKLVGTFSERRLGQ